MTEVRDTSDSDFWCLVDKGLFEDVGVEQAAHDPDLIAFCGGTENTDEERAVLMGNRNRAQILEELGNRHGLSYEEVIQAVQICRFGVLWGRFGDIEWVES